MAVRRASRVDRMLAGVPEPELCVGFVGSDEVDLDLSGRHLVFEREPELFVYYLDTGDAVRLPQTFSAHNLTVSGNRVIFGTLDGVYTFVIP